ncbi:MAG: DUF86 domain-containing protein [Acidobacteria bacterium]|nr:DUF86 domain-containing protein [Acidobacteriota bacterium]
MSSDTRRAPALSPLFVGARRWPSRPARAAWDPVRVLIMERAELRRCAERTRDISAHASFVRLAELGIVDPAFAKRIARSAGLRNRLVHDYEGIDHPKVFAALVDALDDVPQYLERLHRHLVPSQES